MNSSLISAGASASVRPPILSIHHTALRCFDAEDTRRFYQDVLALDFFAASIFDHNGFKPVDFMHLFFRMGEGDFLAFFDTPDDIQPDFYERYERADFRKTLRVPTDADLEALTQRLSSAGVPFEGPVEECHAKSIFFKDPDGINLEVMVAAPGREEFLGQEKERARVVLAEWSRKTAAKKSGVKRPQQVPA